MSSRTHQGRGEEPEEKRALNAEFVEDLAGLLEAHFHEYFEDGEPKADFPAIEIAPHLYNSDNKTLLERLAGLKQAYENGFFDSEDVTFPDLAIFLDQWNFDEIENWIIEDAGLQPPDDDAMDVDEEEEEDMPPPLAMSGLTTTQVETRTRVRPRNRMTLLAVEVPPEQPVPDPRRPDDAFVPLNPSLDEERDWNSRLQIGYQAREEQQRAQDERERDARAQGQPETEEEVRARQQQPPSPNPMTVPTRPAEAPPAPPNAPDLGVRSNLMADPEDCLNRHFWKGQQLPPIGIRLRHVLNFLSDEDVDRDPLWEDHAEEIREWLHFLLTDDQFSDLGDNKLGNGTKNLIREAIRRLAAHGIFQEWHSAKDQVSIVNKDDIPRPKQRLKPFAGFPNVQLGKKVVDVKLPRTTQHRPRKPGYVIDMDHHPDPDNNHTILAEAEHEYWQLLEVSTDNVFAIEQDEYEACLKERTGWTIPSSDNRRRRLLNRTRRPIDISKIEDFAAEHGSNRAGLQQTLQFFNNAETAGYQTRWRRVQLPLSAKALKDAHRSTTGVQYKPQVIENAVLDKHDLEPQPFTQAMMSIRVRREWFMNQARIKVEAEHQGEEKWPRLPKFYGAITTPPFPASVTDELLLFREMKKVKALLAQAQKIFNTEDRPRPLLNEVLKFIEEGETLIHDRRPVSETGLELRPNFDWDVVNKTAKEITLEEVMWLSFLVNSASVNEKLVEDLPHQNATLFLIFAERLQAIMNDLSEGSVFPAADTFVTIDVLLHHINRCTWAHGRYKVIFSVYDAMAFCERLSKFGRCRFFEDEEHLAYVQRPVYDLHPEHLIRPDEKIDGKLAFVGRMRKKGPYQPTVFTEDKIGAPRRKHDLFDTWQAANAGKTDDLHNAIKTFFHCLAFRFGLTYRRILKVGLGKLLEREQLSTRSMARAWIAWQEEYNNMTEQAKRAEDPKPGISFCDLVERADPKLFKEKDGALNELEARDIVAEKLIIEASQNLNPLHPTRLEPIIIEDIEQGEVVKTLKIVRRRPRVWEWAKPSVRGKARSYFNMNRWPLKLVSEEQSKTIQSDADLDPRELFDPLSEDPVAPTWYRRKAEMYVDKRVIYREGPSSYTIGDTARQREMVQGHATLALMLEWGLMPADPKDGNNGSGGNNGGGSGGGGSGGGGGGNDGDSSNGDNGDNDEIDDQPLLPIPPVARLPDIDSVTRGFVPRSRAWSNVLETETEAPPPGPRPAHWLPPPEDKTAQGRKRPAPSGTTSSSKKAKTGAGTASGENDDAANPKTEAELKQAEDARVAEEKRQQARAEAEAQAQKDRADAEAAQVEKDAADYVRHETPPPEPESPLMS